jgi:hypothetical protein
MAAAARHRLCMNTGMNTVTRVVTNRCAAANQSLSEMQIQKCKQESGSRHGFSSDQVRGGQSRA